MTASPPEPEIAIHEDDEGMRNLYPMPAHDEAASDIRAALDAGFRNKVTGGIGWTDVHVIKPPSTTFADAGLTLDDTIAVLSPLMPRVRRFWSGLLGRNDPLAGKQADAYCFGFDGTCFVKLEPKGEFVERIWFEARTNDDPHLAMLRKALVAIDALSPALIADYWLDVTGPVGDQTFLDSYFNALSEP